MSQRNLRIRRYSRKGRHWWIMFILCLYAFCGVVSAQSIDKQKIRLDDKGVDTLNSCLRFLKLSDEFLDKNLDSALYYGLAARKALEQSYSDTLKIEVLKSLGDVYMSRGNMPAALDNFLQAKVLADDLTEKHPANTTYALKEVDLITTIGLLSYFQKDYKKSTNYYEKALSVLENVYKLNPSLDLRIRKIRIFNNLAGIYIQQENYTMALRYFQNAMEINDQLGDLANKSSLSNNIGICYMEEGEHDLANHYFLQALEIRKKLGNMRGQAQCLNNIGKNFVLRGDFKKAKENYEEALTIGRSIGNAESILISLESLSSVNDTLHNYKASLSAFKEFKTLNDSLFNSHSKEKMAKLEQTYRQEKQAKIDELEKQKTKAEQQRREIWYIAIAGALFFLLLTAFLLIVLMRGKIKNGKLQQEKLKLEHENLELERRTLQESLEFKEKELTANALYLLKNNELISDIAEKLIQAKATFKKENQKIIHDIIFELRASQNTHIWEEFETHFIQVHSDFYEALKERFPNLTSNEKKLCAFLRLNMSTKDISAITYQSVNSITVARSRLRKKLNIDGEDVNLVNFLMQF